MVTIFIASGIVFVIAVTCLSLSLLIRKRPIQKKCAGCTCEEDHPREHGTCNGEHSAVTTGE